MGHVCTAVATWKLCSDTCPLLQSFVYPTGGRQSQFANRCSDSLSDRRHFVDYPKKQHQDTSDPVTLTAFAATTFCRRFTGKPPRNDEHRLSHWSDSSRQMETDNRVALPFARSPAQLQTPYRARSLLEKRAASTYLPVRTQPTQDPNFDNKTRNPNIFRRRIHCGTLTDFKSHTQNILGINFPRFSSASSYTHFRRQNFCMHSLCPLSSIHVQLVADLLPYLKIYKNADWNVGSKDSTKKFFSFKTSLHDDSRVNTKLQK